MSIDALFAAIAKVANYLLPVLGVVILVYLILLVRTLIDTLKDLSLTLLTAESEIKKLDGPLNTVDSISKTIDEVHIKTKDMVSKAGVTLNKDVEEAKEWIVKKKEDLAQKKAEAAKKVEETIQDAEIAASLAKNEEVVKELQKTEPDEEEIIYVRNE